MNLWIETARDDLVEVLRRCDLVFLNDEEARLLSDRHHLPGAVAAIQELGPRRVVVKKGEHGAILFDGDARFVLPAFLLDEVHDPTGAGDTFAGGFLGHLARAAEETPATLQEAMILGTVMASYVTESFGVDRLLSLSPQDIEVRRRALQTLTAWPV